nr:MAG TPA: hypothetical protein [Caudoviricetes sp.]
MEELKIHGKYKKEDGKKIMRIINEIKLRGMQLARIVDESDMPIIVNIIAGRLLQYSVEKGIERGDKMMGEIEDRFLHGLMLVERDNTLMTVEEYLRVLAEVDFDTIVIQNKSGEVLYRGDRNEDIPWKFKYACAEQTELGEYREAVITLASDK